jgi:hypothetical protein
MMTLPLHTSHALQLLDMTFFKPFKKDFKKERYFAMTNLLKNKSNKVTPMEWVDKALQ